MRKIFKALRKQIYVNNFIYIDLWAIVHFATGYLLFALFRIDQLLAWGLIVGFEIIEPYIRHFKREHPADTFWDIVLGMSGYYIARAFLL